jgi:hypothetical protein
MTTLYDDIFSEHSITGRVYFHRKTWERYSVQSFSLNENEMTLDLGNKCRKDKIIPHFHDVHVFSMTPGDLEILANARE